MDNLPEIVEAAVEAAFAPFEAGANMTPTRIQHALQTVAQHAYAEGRHDALSDLMTDADVAVHFGISQRRARALIKNRHERFGAGKQIGSQWVVTRGELAVLAPNAKYRRKSAED